MNLKVHNTGDMLLHVKSIKPPHSLTAADIVCIKVKLNLIPASLKLHSGAIMAFIHILIDVFDSLY